MFGTAALVIVERLHLAGEEPFGPELSVTAIVRQGRRNQRLRESGWNFRHRETGVEVLHLHSHTTGAP
jgi:hypothetical protein